MTLEELKQTRTNTKKSITRIKNIIENSAKGEGKILSPAELKCRLGILESYFKELLTIQTHIENADTKDNCRSDLEELYITTKIAIQTQLGEELHNATLSETSCVMPMPSSKLPKLKLPSFSGKYSEYKNFIVSFSQLVDREISYNNIEKFNHLLNCLHGPALETVKAFQVTNENYPKALERLKERYDNTTLIFLENITSLFDLPAIVKSNGTELRSLVDNASALFGSLLSLGSEKEISESMLIYLVLQKADEQSRNIWKQSLDFQNLPTWRECVKTLERHCQYLESLDSTHANFAEPRVSEKNKTLQHTKNKQTTRKGYSFASLGPTCVVCSSAKHKINNCDRFKNLDVAHRFDNVKKLGLCINCLSKGHQLSNCPSSHRCKVCSCQHHSLLHRNSDASENTFSTTARSALQLSASLASPTAPASSASFSSREAAVHTHMETSSFENIILATAMVLVRDSSGCYRLGRALLDSCSQVNFVTEEFCQKLQLPKGKHNIEIHSVGNSSTNIKFKTSTTIKSRFNNFELPLTFCVTSHIAYQPEAEIDVSTWNLPQNGELADEQFFKSKRIDLLLGTESFFSILSVGQIRLGENLPIVQKTLLGWVVSGKYQRPLNTQISTCMFAYDDSLDEKLERLWKLEEVSSAADVWTREQHSCELVYTEATSRNLEGRIVVKLPFKDDPNCLGQSYTTALQRFVAQERRLSRSPDLKAQYIAFMEEYENLGHMSVVSVPNLTEPHYYIPHHYILKPNSTSTKLRVVFDASSLTSSQKSLNDIEMVGPTLQNELFVLLLRFRLYRYAVTADIIKMYRQILVAPEDRRFQYILWRNSPDQNIRTYQLNTVTYGMASAPYLAVRSLIYLADLYASQYKVGSRVIKSSFYVDDLLCGADSLAELARIRHEVTEVLKQGCFELAKWHSNHQDYRDDKNIKNLNLDDSSITSTLGLKWDQQADKFLFSFEPKQKITNRVTKRSILSIASSLFDPLGLVSPIIITAKIILQELWLLKLDWDESVPQNLHLAWDNFVQSLSSLPSLSIPRYCLSSNIKSVHIHGFCDSSIRAYGCSTYTRVVDTSGNISVHLLTAKSRVAPTKKQSLPKLELCGALLLARLYQKIKVIFENYKIDVYLWTDSQIVLHWLKVHSATLSTFVGNRVSEIQELSTDAHWRHVSTHSNPADIVSRGATVEELKRSIWFSGPSFLIEDQSKWPVSKCDNLDMEEIQKEKRKSAFKLAVSSNYILDVIDKYSSYTHSLRVIATIFRFYRRVSRQHQYDIEAASLSPQELQHSLLCIVWNIQQKYFAEDIHQLMSNSTTKGTLKFLNPFLENTSGFILLKVGGRLELSSFSDGHKHPILLPSKCEFVIRYVRHLHLKNFHAGPKALVGLIRLEFWIVNARDLARRVVRSCVHCVRYKPKLLENMMGNLPVERLTPSRPFSRCGVDFCGPVNTYLRIRGKPPYKTYIAIFICLATKAVHIEVVSELSTDAFLTSLKRMIGRRGLPSDIFCDNATNFVGACSRLAELKAFIFNKEHQNTIVKYCANEFINFHFIPPRAPHFGGLWEAAVKSAKGHLNRSFMTARLTFEELATILIEIEAILNSRPISPLSSDPSDLEALTPAHFLIGSSLKSLPERTAPADIDNLEKWARVSGIKQHFWKRWAHDYVNELQMRTKWTSNQPNISNGTMVIVHEDNVPPQRWQLGRIIKCIPGSDSRVRVVDVRTMRGVIRRPIRKLAILPA